MNKHIGKFITERLKQIKRKQGHLAEACGVSENAVSKWKRTGEITLENAMCVADFLDCSLDDLVGRMRMQNEFERQLMLFFKGMSMEHKEDLLAQAQAWYTRDNPDDKKANPFPHKPKPSQEDAEQ